MNSHRTLRLWIYVACILASFYQSFAGTESLGDHRTHPFHHKSLKIEYVSSDYGVNKARIWVDEQEWTLRKIGQGDVVTAFLMERPSDPQYKKYVIKIPYSSNPIDTIRNTRMIMEDYREATSLLGSEFFAETWGTIFYSNQEPVKAAIFQEYIGLRSTYSPSGSPSFFETMKRASYKFRANAKNSIWKFISANRVSWKKNQKFVSDLKPLNFGFQENGNLKIYDFGVSSEETEYVSLKSQEKHILEGSQVKWWWCRRFAPM